MTEISSLSQVSMSLCKNGLKQQAVDKLNRSAPLVIHGTVANSKGSDGKAVVKYHGQLHNACK